MSKSSADNGETAENRKMKINPETQDSKSFLSAEFPLTSGTGRLYVKG